MINDGKEQYVIDYDSIVFGTNELKSIGWRKFKNKYADPCKLFCFGIINQARLPKMDEIGVILENNTKHDIDNLPGGVGKIFVDQLVKAKRIPDDKEDHYKFLLCRKNKDLKKGTLRFTIIRYK